MEVLEADEGTAEREERFVDVGPLVVADTEASKLIEPGKCPLDDPPPSSQTPAVLGAAHRQQRHDAASSQPRSDCLCIVAAVSHHTIWAMPRPSPLALEWKNRIHQRQCLLRVVSVGAGQAHGERARLARRKSDGACSRAWPVRWDSDQSGHRHAPRGWNNCPRPLATINLIVSSEPIQQREVNEIQHARSLPIAQAARNVIPDPHPSSCGSICQGTPLRRTNECW